MPYSKLLAPINNFLKVPTPASWLEEAKAEKNLPVLLIDHLICELKVYVCKFTFFSGNFKGNCSVRYIKHRFGC